MEKDDIEASRPDGRPPVRFASEVLGGREVVKRIRDIDGDVVRYEFLKPVNDSKKVTT